LETTGGQSSAIGYYYTVSGSVDFEKQYAEGVNAVTAQQVQELAGKWLATRASASRVVIRPKN
jgi:predicted Zn-dependent peptidase